MPFELKFDLLEAYLCVQIYMWLCVYVPMCTLLKASVLNTVDVDQNVYMLALCMM